MTKGLSIREFARRDGCSDTLVRRAIKQNRIKQLDDGTIDPSLVGTAWRSTNAKSAKSANPAANTQESVRSSQQPKKELEYPGVPEGNLADQAKAIIESDGAPHEYAEALRRKENYIALLRQLEYEQKAGRLIDLEKAEQIIFGLLREVRDAWLNWPTRVGPLIAADLDCEADRVTEILNTHVHKQLSILGDPEVNFTQD